MFKRITAAILCAISLVTLGAPLASAEDDNSKPPVWLQISPVSNRVTLEAGKELDYDFTVSNIGSEEFTYNVYATPYSISNESYDVNFSTETTRTQLSRWIQFYQEDGTLADKATYKIGVDEKQTIKYRINVPEDIPDGGQYATIFAESDSKDELKDSSGIKTVSRVGLILYGRTNGDTREEAEITDYNFPAFLTGDKIHTSARIKNTGNTDFQATSEFSVKTIFGKDIYESNVDYDILPDTERLIKSEWENTPFIGVFQVHYKISALDHSEDKTKLVIIMPVFLIIIILILLTFLIIWIIILIRKRRERRSKLLV